MHGDPVRRARPGRLQPDGEVPLDEVSAAMPVRHVRGGGSA
ncbi:hypothetical protein [Salinispora pacifica]|nr:hypothetical protein [Salinispora pacifica]